MGWWTDWRRKRVLARHAIDDRLWRRVALHYPFIGELDRIDADRLRELTLLFLAEKTFTGAGGLVLTDAMRVTVAAQACLPILNLGLEWYDGWVGVVVYPGDFRVRRNETDAAGIVHEWDDALAGESMPGGPVVLSWDAAARDVGMNVVIHEFAHKLDMRDGDANGVPPLHRDMDPAAWRSAFDTALKGFRDALAQETDTWLDPYAAEDPAEFFAVLSEAFFEWPQETERRYPDVYEQLTLFYRQDPARRLPG